MTEEVKRGPGRPPKVARVESGEADTNEPGEHVEVICRAYKVFTSAGRLVEGQRCGLPIGEAEDLASKGEVEIV